VLGVFVCLGVCLFLCVFLCVCVLRDNRDKHSMSGH